MNKSLYAFVVLLVVAMLAVSCAAPQPAATPAAPVAATNAPQPATVAPTSTKAPEPTNTPEPTATAVKEKVTLTYMASQDWIMDAEQALGKKFEEQTGIHIDYQIIPSDQYFQRAARPN